MTTEQKKIAYVIDVELSLSLEEITKLKRLSELEKKTLEQTARACMNDYCDILLKSWDETVQELKTDTKEGIDVT